MHLSIMFIGICGVGFVGGALKYSFNRLGIEHIEYDKYKNLGDFESLLQCNIIFLCLPTLLNHENDYDLTSLEETLCKLKKMQFSGLIVIKSTVVPGTTEKMGAKYNLDILHNPEFLTARTANDDFHNQTHIVIGKTTNCPQEKVDECVKFYETYYKNARISLATSHESEAMKIFCNSFYCVKLGFFNEMFNYCNHFDIDYNRCRDLMLHNNWINKMHTQVPGPDGNLGYGGYCLPKDSTALLNSMKKNSTNSSILEATILENKKIREK